MSHIAIRDSIKNGFKSWTVTDQASRVIIILSNTKFRKII